MSSTSVAVSTTHQAADYGEQRIVTLRIFNGNIHRLGLLAFCEAAVVVLALYAAVFEPTVAALDLWHLPASHARGPTFLNVLKYLDTPQAVALALPRKITLHVRTDKESAAWAWPARIDAAGERPALD